MTSTSQNKNNIHTYILALSKIIHTEMNTTYTPKHLTKIIIIKVFQKKKH